MNNKHLIYNESLEAIIKNIKGGFEGLEYLFNIRIANCKRNNYKLNHNNFFDFYSGIPVEILGIEEKVFVENSGKIKSLDIENFYEEYFQFYYDPTSFNVFHSPFNVLQEVINMLREITLVSTFETEEKRMFFSETIAYINNEIEKSLKTKKEDNPILFPKLNYIKNGYVLVYNKVWELFGVWLVGVEKKDFEANLPIIVKSYEDSINLPWFEVGLLFAKGEIQKYRHENPSESYPKIVKHFDNDKYLPYVKAVFGEYKTNKNIYINKKKMEELKDYCIDNKIEMCEEFREKLAFLSEY